MLNAALNSLDADSEEDDCGCPCTESSTRPQKLTCIAVEGFLEKLRFFFSENLVLAALDLVDRENGQQSPQRPELHFLTLFAATFSHQAIDTLGLLSF